jgi:cephalosporin-C deacetylase-like acetyl esterase
VGKKTGGKVKRTIKIVIAVAVVRKEIRKKSMYRYRQMYKDCKQTSSSSSGLSTVDEEKV